MSSAAGLVALALAGCTPSAESPGPTDDEPPGNNASGGSGGSGGRGTSGPGGSGSGGAAGAAGRGGAAGGDNADGAAGEPGGSGDGGASARDAAAARTDSRTTPGLDGPAPPNVGGPPPPCKHTFCESFENYVVGGAPDRTIWTRESSRIVVDATRAARGTKSLRIPMISSGQWFIRTTKPFPALGTALYGRMFFWIDQQPQMDPAGVYHWTVLEASDRATGFGKVLRYGGIMSSPTDNHFFFNIETHGMGETGRNDARARPAPKVWHCIEWSFIKEGNKARFWWNGQERPLLAWPEPGSTDPKYTDPRFFFPEMKSISFGWAEYQQVDTPWDVWIDEIALHTEKIGCDG